MRGRVLGSARGSWAARGPKYVNSPACAIYCKSELLPRRAAEQIGSRRILSLANQRRLRARLVHGEPGVPHRAAVPSAMNKPCADALGLSARADAWACNHGPTVAADCRDHAEATVGGWRLGLPDGVWSAAWRGAACERSRIYGSVHHPVLDGWRPYCSKSKRGRRSASR